MKQAGKLCESEAFEILAERHRGTALSIFTIVAGRGDEPDRAIVQCSKCGATFEFHSDGGWRRSSLTRTPSAKSELWWRTAR